MSREFLSLEQLMEASVVPDDDPYRLSEMARIFRRVLRGWIDINIKLLDAIPSGRQSPTEEFNDLAFYSGLFIGVGSRLHEDILNKHPQLIGKVISLDQQNEDPIDNENPIDIDAMRRDALGLAYGRWIGIKDWA